MKNLLSFATLLIVFLLYSGAFAQSSKMERKHAEEMQAIKQVLLNETQAWATKDYDTWAKCWHDDPTTVWRHTIRREQYHGWDAIDSAFRASYFDTDLEPVGKHWSGESSDFHFHVDGNHGWVLYKQSIQTTWMGKEFKYSSKEVRFLDKKGGDWKINYMSTTPDYPLTSEWIEFDLNNVGYKYMDLGLSDKAVSVFRLICDLYPESFNAHDSLAEAYMQEGEKELAIAHYKKSLALNPKNTNAVDMLKALGADPGE